MAFEVFDKRATAMRVAPAVTIQKRGVISLNRAAYELLGTPEHVELLYDPDAAVVGIRGVGSDVPHGYIVRRPSRSAGTGPVMIAGRAFARYYRIDVSITRRFAARIDEDVLCIDLATGTRVIGNRSQRPGAGHNTDTAG